MRDVTYVFHAAALKHVDAGEYSPEEFVKTNINGTINVINQSIQAESVKRVVLLSTDKAVEPINLYGTTKAVAEKLTIRANGLSPDGTTFVVVRYGNVTGSRGSVLPHWKESLAQKNPLRLTDDRMTRFWISLDDAVHAAYFAMHRAPRGVIIIPHLYSYKLQDLGIALAGVKYPWDIVGIRPGEKLHESLMIKEEIPRCFLNEKYYCIKPVSPSWDTTGIHYGEPAMYNPSTHRPYVYRSDAWPWRMNISTLAQLLVQEKD